MAEPALARGVSPPDQDDLRIESDDPGPIARRARLPLLPRGVGLLCMGFMLSVTAFGLPRLNMAKIWFGWPEGFSFMSWRLVIWFGWLSIGTLMVFGYLIHRDSQRRAQADGRGMVLPHTGLVVMCALQLLVAGVLLMPWLGPALFDSMGQNPIDALELSLKMEGWLGDKGLFVFQALLAVGLLIQGIVTLLLPAPPLPLEPRYLHRIEDDERCPACNAIIPPLRERCPSCGADPTVYEF